MEITPSPRSVFQYIHYFDGSEELYDLKNDPHQFINIASDSIHAYRKENLKDLLPPEPTYRHFIRYNNFKAMIPSDGSDMILFDLAYQNHINQQTNIADRLPRYRR